MSLSTYALLLGIVFIFPPAVFVIVGALAFRTIPTKQSV